MSGDDGKRPGWPAWRHAWIVLLVAACVYWPRLGATYFTNTEGHRVIPGWGMLEHGEWFLPKLFGQVYLRKPPGMAWAVAASGAVFGESEFSARAVSALASTIAALLALVFGARWFGRKYGIAAGLAMALTPVFWGAGRSAEIEALNDCATAGAVWLILDMMIGSAGRGRGVGFGVAMLAGVAMAAAAMANGPAWFAAIGMATVCGMGLQRMGGFSAGDEESGRSSSGGAKGSKLVPRWGGRRLRPLIAAFATAAVLIAFVAAMVARAVHFSDQVPVTQGVSEFLWAGSERSARGVLRVLAMPVLAVASALPMSLALLFPWGRDARAEAGEAMPARSVALARAVAGSCVSSLLLMMALGVHNPRYALPSLSVVPVLASYVARGCDGAFGSVRRRIANRMFLGHRAAWPVLLLIGAAVYIGAIEPRQRESSGRRAGEALGDALPDGAFVWADGLVEARPEVLLYAQREAAGNGKQVRFAWVRDMANPNRLSLPRLGGYMIVRTDLEGDERAGYERQGFMDRLKLVTTGHAYKYDFAVYRMVRPGEGEKP